MCDAFSVWHKSCFLWRVCDKCVTHLVCDISLVFTTYVLFLWRCDNKAVCVTQFCVWHRTVWHTQACFCGDRTVWHTQTSFYGGITVRLCYTFSVWQILFLASCHMFDFIHVLQSYVWRIPCDTWDTSYMCCSHTYDVSHVIRHTYAGIRVRMSYVWHTYMWYVWLQHFDIMTATLWHTYMWYAWLQHFDIKTKLSP